MPEQDSAFLLKPTRLRRQGVSAATPTSTRSTRRHCQATPTSRHTPHLDDGHQRWSFQRAAAHLQAEQLRLSHLREEHPHRLPDRCDGRGVQHECHHLRPQRRRGLRAALHRSHWRPRENRANGGCTPDWTYHTSRARSDAHRPRWSGVCHPSTRLESAIESLSC